MELFKNFSPLDHFCCDGGGPDEGTEWARWVAGLEPKIPVDFAWLLWWNFCSAMDNIVNPLTSDWPAELQYHSAGLTLFNEIFCDLVQRIRFAQEVEGVALMRPFTFESIVGPRGKAIDVDEKPYRVMSAYAVWCMDQCIEGLLTDQPQKAAMGGAYAFGCLEIAREYRDGVRDEARVKEILSEKQREAAGARHKENRQMKAEVMEWCKSEMHTFKSMDSAAEAIAGKLVPVTFRTARQWIGEWAKLEQSAGRQ